MPLRSWLDLPDDTLRPIEALPYAAGRPRGTGPSRVLVAVGDLVLDAGAAAAATGSDHCELLAATSLLPLLAAGPAVWTAVRAELQGWLTDGSARGAVAPHLSPADAAVLDLPVAIADYVDFYSSEHHAANLGRIFRPGTEPLAPSWRHLPVGYHGRAGTVVVSGTPVVRPRGHVRPPGAEAPAYAASRRLDIEAEVGVLVGVGSRLGEPVPLARFADHAFGVCLVNDWSARDIQAFESVPLGPFLGKSFATSMSAWVLPLAALEAARRPGPPRDPAPLPHLDDAAHPWGLDLSLEVRLNGHPVARPPFAGMYWTVAQQLAHATANGASLRTGDLLASGTVSGPERDQRGSLIELSWNGAEPLTLPDGSERSFLEDGDEVVITATAPGPGGCVIGLGEVRGRVAPALR